MYSILRKTEKFRNSLKKHRILRDIMGLAGEFVLWINHFRKNVRKEVEGITYELNLNEMIDRSIYMSGCFEHELTNAINALTKPGYTVLDIGANMGCHTLRFSKLIGPEGRVFAFEPMSYAYYKIKRNIDLNVQFSHNITLERKAVSNVSVRDQLISFKSSWLRFDKETVQEDTVDFVTVDDYVLQKRIKCVDIIKIDVDGFEPEVLEGAEDTIKTHKPILFLEVNNTPKIESILNFLLSINYRFVSEKGYTAVSSKEEIISIVDNIPVNSTGFKAANFILVNDESDFDHLKGLRWNNIRKNL